MELAECVEETVRLEERHRALPAAVGDGIVARLAGRGRVEAIADGGVQRMVDEGGREHVEQGREGIDGEHRRLW
jgi:hypothetical protein